MNVGNLLKTNVPTDAIVLGTFDEKNRSYNKAV